MKPIETPNPAAQRDLTVNRRFCIAPMMDWTDRHYRFFARLISDHAVLYTEMITTGAILHGDQDRFLRFNPEEHPVAIQLGGSRPEELAACAKLAEAWGYDEVNLNVGCPSDRVQNNMIGACLMGHSELVRDCLKAMMDEVSIPVTIKHRLGIDDQDSYQELVDFVGTVAQSGCKTFIVHARKAILSGLSPKENRDIPPLKYEQVYQLKTDFPDLEIIINGGIKQLEECQTHLNHVDGVMIGREAYQRPWLLADIDHHLYGCEARNMTPHDIGEKLLPYIDRCLQEGQYLGHITRHILGLFHGMPGGKRFRRYLSENAHKSGAGTEVFREALQQVSMSYYSNDTSA